MTRTQRLAAAIVAAIWTAAAVLGLLTVADLLTAAVVVCLGLVAWARG